MTQWNIWFIEILLSHHGSAKALSSPDVLVQKQCSIYRQDVAAVFLHKKITFDNTG